MASRMLHYIITKEIANSIQISDINRFIVGSLLPDASSYSDGSYDTAHFQDWSPDDSKKGINWSLFRKKYEYEIQNDSLYVGYLCHLITDAIWFKRMTDPYIRIYPKNERPAYINKGYHDFKLLNALLIDTYQVSCPMLQVPKVVLEEIDSALIEQIFMGFIDDFHVLDQYRKEELTVYPYVDVEKFISESITKCLGVLSPLTGKVEFIDPELYYTETFT